MNEAYSASKSLVKWRAGFICAAFSVLAILAARPFVGMGVNDDFSYTQIAKNLAQTGTLVYNGWNTPMIGMQAYWAALMIKLFGFSFDLVRLTTLPFVAGSALLIYYLARRMGASLLIASLTSGFVMLSPLTIPLGASFMTDIPALFFTLLCFVVTLCAVDAQANPARWFWIVFLVLIGVGGGTVRQVIWLAPLFLLPYLAVRASSLRDRALIAILWLCTFFLVRELSAWFAAQPYSVALPLLTGQRATVRAMFVNAAGLYLECSILFIPFFALYAKQFSKLTARTKAAVLLIAIGIPAGLFALTLVHPSSNLIAFDYFAGNIITKFGILGSGVEALGVKPIVVPVLLQLLLLVAALLFQLIAVAACLPELRNALQHWVKGPRRIVEALRNSGSVATVCQILLVFLAPYALAVASRAYVGLAIDRYLLPLLAIGALLFLSIPLPSPSFSLRLASFSLFLFCLYGIATTHDYFACSRARLAAANELLVRKVNDTNITAGLEFDGWTQIRQTGYINDSRITIPAHAYIALDPKKFALAEPYWFWYFTPSIQPKYFVVLSTLAQLAPSELPPIPYTSWIPPFHREVLIEVSRPIPQNVGKGESASKLPSTDRSGI